MKLRDIVFTKRFIFACQALGKGTFVLNKQEFVTIVRNISKRLELSATLPGAFNWSIALWKRLSPLRHWHLTIQLGLHVRNVENWTESVTWIFVCFLPPTN